MTKARTIGQKKRRPRGSDGATAASQAAPVSDTSQTEKAVQPPQEQLQRPHEISGGKGTPQRIRFRDTTPLELSHARGGITARQLAAGDAFEALYRAVRTVGGIRDSLDMAPRGHGGEVTRREIAVADKWRELTRTLGITRTAVMVSVCIHWEPLKGLTGQQRGWLTEALNATADFFGLAFDDAA